MAPPREDRVPGARGSLSSLLAVASRALAQGFRGWRAGTRQSLRSATRRAADGHSIADELSLLIDGASNYAIYMLDPQGRVTIWNKGAERIKGWSEEEVLGRDVSIFYLPEEAAAGKPQADLAQAVELGRLSQEEWGVRKDGSRFLADITITPLRDDDGELVGFGKVVRDITQERAAASALESRESQLASILAAVPDAMVVIDDQGLIASFSAAAERLFAYKEAEVLGKNVSVLMPSPDREAHDNYLAHYAATGERRIIGRARRVLGKKSDGTIFPLELAIGEARGGGKQIFTGFIRDLTAKEETDAHVQQLQSELLHVSRISAMGTMASTLAHELNQPITAVANYVETGRDILANPDPETIALVREALDEAASEALRAGRIVRRLREFVSKGEVEQRIEKLAPLIDEAAVLGLMGAREKGIAVVIHFDAADTTVLADRVQIQQVVINLLRNAVEAVSHQQGGRVSVSTKGAGRMVEIVVEDNGPGLKDIDPEQLFQAFVSTKAEGMGLGLSICRTIVEAHGGRIWCESSPAGARFHFTLLQADVTEGAEEPHV